MQLTLTLLALAMIIVFIAVLAKKKLTVYAALSLIPLVFGIIAAIATNRSILDVFTWIKNGVFFSQNATTGKISWGVISPAIIILFAVLYFGIMLNAGLFDPLATFFIKRAKGDPLKVAMATVFVASVVTLNGDTTTTVLICVAAFLNLYKQLKMKLIYLAIIIVAPIGIFNQLPWGGPSIAAAAALGVDLNVLFAKILPGMLVAEVFVIGMTYFLGLKERKRLNFTPAAAKEITPEQMSVMLSAITDKDPELKRPKLFWFNLIFTLFLLFAMIQGYAHGAVVFMLGSFIALTINYRTVEECKARLDALAADVLPPALATLAAGVFSGVLSGSGMATQMAKSIASIIPASLGAHMAPVYALISAPAITFLPQDAFYFGIASVVAGVMAQFGISAEEAAVASMVGQSFRLISPVIPALYMLCEETETNFVDFQKEYTKYFWPIIFIYLIVHTLTGAMPF